MGKPETAKKYLEGGIRTRGSQGPDDSQGRGAHMEQEHGAFKVNPPVGLFTAGRARLEMSAGWIGWLLEIYTGASFW